MNLQKVGDMKKADDKVKNIVEEVDWKDKYIRVLADYQNLEKRSLEQVHDARLFASEIVISRLLPVVDTFEKVSEHIKDAGFDLAYKQLLLVLKEHGVERIIVVGKPFNPHEMECIEVVLGENDIIVEETLPGYTFRGKVLRVARVKVGKKMNESANDKSTNKSDNGSNP